MDKVKVLIRRGTKTKIGAFKETTFDDLGNGLVRDSDGNRFYMVVTSRDGGYLRGDGNIVFKFPR